MVHEAIDFENCLIEHFAVSGDSFDKYFHFALLVLARPLLMRAVFALPVVLREELLRRAASARLPEPDLPPGFAAAVAFERALLTTFAAVLLPLREPAAAPAPLTLAPARDRLEGFTRFTLLRECLLSPSLPPLAVRAALVLGAALLALTPRGTSFLAERALSKALAS